MGIVRLPVLVGWQMQGRVPQIECEPQKPGAVALPVQPGDGIVHLIHRRIADCAGSHAIDNLVPGEERFRSPAHQAGEMVEPGQVWVIRPTIAVARQMPFADGRRSVSGFRIRLECHGQRELFREKIGPRQSAVRGRRRVGHIRGFGGCPRGNFRGRRHGPATYRTADAGAEPIASRQHRGPSRRADGLSPEIGEPHALARQDVERGGCRRLLTQPIGCKGVHAHVIADDEQDIGRRVHAAPQQAQPASC